jgi:DNA end-binding protein Ku
LNAQTAFRNLAPLVMETIFYPDEVRDIAQVPNLPKQVNVNDKELSLAKMLKRCT